MNKTLLYSIIAGVVVLVIIVLLGMYSYSTVQYESGFKQGFDQGVAVQTQTEIDSIASCVATTTAVIGYIDIPKNKTYTFNCKDLAKIVFTGIPAI